MGFFSWKTQDTNRSIPNVHSVRTPFTVIMADNKGQVWIEHEYDGYGVFDGKDYYELLDEMNGGTGDREVGIDRVYSGNSKYANTIHPSLTECGDYYGGVAPEDCEFQGYFYEEDDYDEN